MQLYYFHLSLLLFILLHASFDRLVPLKFDVWWLLLYIFINTICLVHLVLLSVEDFRADLLV